MDVLNASQYVWVYVFPLALMARTTSVWLTVAIAAQRCIAVTLPLKVYCIYKKYFSLVKTVSVVALEFLRMY